MLRAAIVGTQFFCAEYYWASTDAKAQKAKLKSVKAKKSCKAKK